MSRQPSSRTTDQEQPSAANCSVRPLLERPHRKERKRRAPSKAEPQSAGRLAISVDCRRTRNRHALLFQLAVGKRDPTGELSPGGSPRSLLFSEAAEGRTRIALSDLLDSAGGDSEGLPEAATQSPGSIEELNDAPRGAGGELQARNSSSSSSSESLECESEPELDSDVGAGAESARRKATKLMSLREQVGLLNELVFTIRASDLVRTSEPRAIFGSELRLRWAELGDKLLAANEDQDQDREEDEEGPAQPPASFQTISHHQVRQSSGAAQVSRSASQPEAAAPLTVAMAANVSQARRANQQEQQQHAAGSGGQAAGGGRLAALVEWGRRHEMGVSMAAIGATLVLSLLTLTLIVLVSRAQRQGGQAADFVELSGDGPGERGPTRKRRRRRRMKEGAERSANCSGRQLPACDGGVEGQAGHLVGQYLASCSPLQLSSQDCDELLQAQQVVPFCSPSCSSNEPTTTFASSSQQLQLPAGQFGELDFLAPPAAATTKGPVLQQVAGRQVSYATRPIFIELLDSEMQCSSSGSIG